MIIRNLTKKYMVIQEFMGNDEVHQYICYELDGDQNSEFCAVCQNRSSIKGDEIRFLMEQLNNENFLDLVDFFINRDYFYILFKHNKGKVLKHKIDNEKCSISERLEIIKNILEKILILNISDYFFNAAMDINNIKITQSCEIYFTYNCCDISQFDTITFQDGAKSLAKVIEYIFNYEIKQRSMPELYNFVYSLNNEEIETYLDIYEKYWEIYKIYFGKQQEELKPESLSFKIWNIIKKICSFIKKLIQPALILLAVSYLLISIASFFAEPKYNLNFKTIGTVEIENDDLLEKSQNQEEVIQENNEEVSGVE